MHEVAIPLSISVEQIAEAIKQMAPPDLNRLFELVPNLRNGHVNQAPVHAELMKRTGALYNLDEVELADTQSRQRLSDFFQNSPLAGVELDLARDKDLHRVDFVL